MYVWNGKNTTLPVRKMAYKLAKELWDEGYDYSECELCPVVANSEEKCGDVRPSWTLIAKVTQHMETVLFREKFLDWPDYTRVIKTRRRTSGGQQGDNEPDGCTPAIDLKPCDPRQMIDNRIPEPDLLVENSHLGRGLAYFDEETRRHSEVSVVH
jgi:supervillin